MANIRNIDAEIGANFIGDDAQPTLSMENSSTGPGLFVGRLVGASGASIDTLTTGSILNVSNATTLSGATLGVPLTVGRSVRPAPTVAAMALSVGSTASAPLFELQHQAFASVTTILFTTGAVAGSGAIRVKYGDNYGWIPVLPDGSVTAAPRG